MSVLTGAVIVVKLTEAATNEQVLGALGKRVCDKADQVVVVRQVRGNPVARRAK